MICKKCKKNKHKKCPGGTWCDCQHLEGMVNRVLVPDAYDNSIHSVSMSSPQTVDLNNPSP